MAGPRTNVAGGAEMGIRGAAHRLIDRLEDEQIKGLLLMFEEERFSDEEAREIKAALNSSEWTDWRKVRSDV